MSSCLHKFICAAIVASSLALTAKGQSMPVDTPTDTIYNPTVLFNTIPKTYEIAGIEISGAPNYDDFLVLGYTGLKVGDRITIPGDDVTNAVKRLMRQGLFAQARVKVLKTYGDKAWLGLELRTQPRISEVRYDGVKSGEKKDLQEKLNLLPGNQITQNIVNRAEAIVKKFYADKGFKNADVHISLHQDLSKDNEMIVQIDVNKRDKIKVHKIFINGNEVLSDRQIKNAMKKTNENNDIWKIFSQKKFVTSDYEDDKNRIIGKYNEKGYRDAKITADSIVPVSENRVDVYLTVDEGKRYYIKDINWVGNTVYNQDILNAYLGMKPGDVYNQKMMNKRLN